MITLIAGCSKYQRWMKGARRATRKNMNANAIAAWSGGSDVNHPDTDGFLK